MDEQNSSDQSINDAVNEAASEANSATEQLSSEQPKGDAAEIKQGEKKEPAVIFQISGSFSLTDEGGKEIESGSAKFILDEEKISILSESGKATSILLRDVNDVVSEDYKIQLPFVGGGKVIISELGYQYDDFVKSITKLRHEISQKDLLMQEGGKKAGFKGSYDYQKGEEKQSGEAEVEIFDTGLVIKPKRGDLIRIPFAEIEDFSKKDYNISINTELATLSLFDFGEKFNSLNKALGDALNELSLKTQAVIKDLLPELDPLVIKKASELLRDGRAVNKDEINKISSQIWQSLEKKLSTLGIKEFYDFLKSLSKTGQVFIGIKRDLMGDLTGEYIWFLMPIFSDKGDTFLAMEAVSTIEGGGKASYLFNISKDENLEDLVKKINRCMLAINFRREPIYLSDEDLEKPDYSKYKIAVNKIPELKLLRQLFVGRVVHSSLESWKQNVNNLINKK